MQSKSRSKPLSEQITISKVYQNKFSNFKDTQLPVNTQISTIFLFLLFDPSLTSAFKTPFPCLPNNSNLHISSAHLLSHAYFRWLARGHMHSSLTLIFCRWPVQLSVNLEWIIQILSRCFPLKFELVFGDQFRCWWQRNCSVNFRYFGYLHFWLGLGCSV